MEEKKKCKRLGCRQEFFESTNDASACSFHPGKPIFHDLKKGWTCCEVIVYDWDEFQKIKPCGTGFHNDIGESTSNDQSDFYKSSTVNNAQKGIDKFGGEVKEAPKNINDYNKEQEAKRLEQKLAEEQQVKSVFKTQKGLNKCTNKGCLKEYDPEDPKEQGQTACNYHPGQPIFHDLKKSWTCCKVEKYDWDEFMLIKPCAWGAHEPKMI